MAKKKEINWEEVASYAEAGCNQKQIAAVLNISTTTLTNRALEDLKDEKGKPMSIADFVDQHAFKGEADILRMQHKRATDGNVNMLVWMGKQRLNQFDKSSINQTSFTTHMDLSQLSFDELKLLRENPHLSLAEIKAITHGQTPITIEHKEP